MGNQTAVDWLKNILEEMGSADCLDVSWDFFDDAISQAKQKEKEQAFQMFKAGQDSMEEGGMGFDQYYAATYGVQFDDSENNQSI